MSKSKALNDNAGGKLELKLVADMCRVKVTDLFTTDVTILMLTEKKLDQLIEKLQQFKKKKFAKNYTT